MKKTLCILCLLAVLVPAGIALYRRTMAPRQFVILSTNDVHSHLDNIPRLAAAVAACRDTVSCLLVDAGDRWTGDVFVDMAPEPRKPIIDIMNALGYDAATLGNHEFDLGRAFLAERIADCRFRLLCGNVSSPHDDFPEIEPYAIFDLDGIKVGVAGVVTTFDNGHPEGDGPSFEGLEFAPATDAAAASGRALEGKCDVKVLLSHMGYNNDSIFAQNNPRLYDLIVSGHTHQLIDTEVGGTVIGQTGRYLPGVGATTVKMRGHRIAEIDYRIIPLEDYAPDAKYQALVDEICANPYLNEYVGYNAEALDKVGLADMFTSLVKRAAGTEIGMYHLGGIRLTGLPADSVKRATLINADIFISHVRTMKMTPAQLRRLIIDKYNDGSSESHRVDIFMTEPYTIVTDASDRAFDVKFPTLVEGRSYSVASADYIAKNYKGLECEDMVHHDELSVTEIFIDYFENNSPVRFSNVPHNFVVRAENNMSH